MEHNGHRPIEYKPGTEFSGVVGRTVEESSPAWPVITSRAVLAIEGLPLSLCGQPGATRTFALFGAAVSAIGHPGR